MKKFILFLLLVALVGIGGWTIGYGISLSRMQHRPHDSNGIVYWLRDEYHLTPAQFANVKELFRQNEPHVKLLSEQLKKTYEELSESLRATPMDKNLVAQKADAYVKAKEAFKTDRKSHIEAVASIMTPEQSERFLQEVKQHPHD